MVALGARHTHNRHDRDNYVTVKWDNIKSAGVRQFWRDDDRDAMNETAKLNRCAMAEEGHDYSDCGSTVAATITGPFDWDSIMLFSSLQTQYVKIAFIE